MIRGSALSKAYSNKALPAGTIIREWRLEDVLGVGGFGIVYKGRGIYFGELVAIKEYFPSSISERDAEDTVVPIGSDVEEVHALGLKKFVEEAKLLWNLSTPTRHPNIVSVRSLFEVHGTAYMVMDFEDGVSLSRLLKEGRRFNERSLWNIIKPVAEGLDRAHRVGVLHRDIKPPNILITDDNRPVLIDFGSARFEAAEATSTSVTFHTPPYAAVEQYVKTYPQGPWTDIYALAVVLYECVTGEKPPEVLERLHGGLGSPLADGTWPGFGKRFLQAIDAGMTIRPTERPQSIREWLALFGKKDDEPEVSGDDEPTRFFAHEVTSEEIVPVPPPAPGFDQKEPVETQVPSDLNEVQFKRAGQETGASKRKKSAAAAADSAAETAEIVEEVEAPPVEAKPATAKTEHAPAPKKPAAPARDDSKQPQEPWYKNKRNVMLAGGGALALLVAVAGGSYMFGSSEGSENYEPIPGMGDVQLTPVAIADISELAPAERALANDARTAGISAAVVDPLAAVSDQLEKQLAGLQPLLNNPAQAAAAAARTDEMKGMANSANLAFVSALLGEAEAKAQKLSGEVPSTSPAWQSLSSILSTLRSLAQGTTNLTDPAQSLGAARAALAKSQEFSAALPAVYSARAAAKRAADKLPTAPRTTVATTAPGVPATASPTTTATPTAAAPSTSSASASASKKAQLNSIVSSGRSMAQDVIRMGSGATGIRKENARLAKNYDKYLANVADSARGAKTDRDFDELIKKANQTKAYIVFLNKQSSQAQ
ncbi:serine/threonine protein kinase [Sphingomonas sp. G124]|uniref:Serine/threonine protein kinase n=1 Tax=Sphingomonas cremea TaxID=2904799 RepID=A0A9X1TZ08_9SPHN|nr:serine/threonine-protein kinase [Sphingomonas cremea]MCF2515678.1 serine/threonine protein kinase [Sphingomonas cremea]